VEERICELLRNGAVVFDAAAENPAPVEAFKDLIDRAAALAQRWPNLAATDKRMILQILVARIDVQPAAVDITIRQTMLSAAAAPQTAS
jgi:hypothetical protein